MPWLESGQQYSDSGNSGLLGRGWVTGDFFSPPPLFFFFELYLISFLIARIFFKWSQRIRNWIINYIRICSPPLVPNCSSKCWETVNENCGLNPHSLILNQITIHIEHFWTKHCIYNIQCSLLFCGCIKHQLHLFKKIIKSFCNPSQPKIVCIFCYSSSCWISLLYS